MDESAARTRTTNSRIQRDGYVADLVVSPIPAGEIFHYVIQRQGAVQILAWGQERSLAAALESIEEFIEGEKKKRIA